MNNLLSVEDFNDTRFLTDFLHPYFTDLYKDLSLRSMIPNAIKDKKVDRIAFLEYCNLPGIINQRLIKLLDPQNTEMIEQQAFIKIMS